jgi:hypothetical protein
VSVDHTWSPGQRALLRFLEREGLVHDLPTPPPADGGCDDDRLFAAIATLVPPAMVAELLSSRLHLPLVEPGFAIDPSAVEILPAAIAARCGAIPIALNGQTLDVAAANPLDLDAVKTIEFATGRRVRVRVATPQTVRDGLVRIYGAGDASAPAAGPGAPAEPAPPPAEQETHAAEPVTLATEPVTIAAGPAASPEASRILVVAADPEARELLGGALAAAAADWLVMTARNASEASVLLRLTSPHVVVAESPAAHGELAASATDGTVLLASECDDVAELVARARILIDTARNG